MPHKEVKGISSVTQILGVLNKPYLVYWYGKLGTQECEKIKRESAEFGTLIHEFVTRWLKNRDDTSSHFLQTEFMRHYTAEPIEVEPEEPYISKKYGYQGTFDWVEKDVNGELVIADLKVTNSLYPEMGLQLAAYAQLYNEKHRASITRGRIYWLNKKTDKLQIKEYPNLKPYWKVFKLLIPIHKWMKREHE